MAQLRPLSYIPLRDNDGSEFRHRDSGSASRIVPAAFVGWTFLGYVKGAFRMADGTQALDESGAYVVVLEEGACSRVGAGAAGFQEENSTGSHLP